MDCQICFSATTAIEQTIQCQEDSSAVDECNCPCGTFSPARTEGEWHRRDRIFSRDNREACFDIHLSRIPLFHIATTVGPCIILIILMTITFIMPIDKGDRISFGVTIQLSMVVSLVFVTEVLPVKGALPFFATLIIVCMGLMGVFLFFTIGIIMIHGREGSLSPWAKTLFLRHMAKILLLGDLSEKTVGSDDDNDRSIRTAIELVINYAAQTDDKTEVETTTSPGFPELISSVNAVKTEIEELKNTMENNEEVTEYTLLAKVLDRLCIVLYIISIASAVPVIMFYGK
ncbi:5-hydroxytryptamine receptor 3A-like [Branchiostoma floridae]|uniref:5-hydroxytryptamine receptor 3A-like n=1 Tax=Branchiostoma floridae TaxID=7739 RepID=A0A9J7LWG5_BRAFL|nr:5-hydroxytryptamine receptor 3A-like [Branchiostoma floridae]